MPDKSAAITATSTLYGASQGRAASPGDGHSQLHCLHFYQLGQQRGEKLIIINNRLQTGDWEARQLGCITIIIKGTFVISD